MSNAGDSKAPTDWEAIEREYRAGQLSVREIARQHDVSDAAIRKRAKAEGWHRDMSEQVRAAVRSEVVRREVRKDSSCEPANRTEEIARFASRGADAIEGHLTRAARIKALADRLTGELETYMDGGNPTVQIFVSRSDSPATIIRTLADTAERIQKLERQALNLDDESARDGNLTIHFDRADSEA